MKKFSAVLSLLGMTLLAFAGCPGKTPIYPPPPATDTPTSTITSSNTPTAISTPTSTPTHTATPTVTSTPDLADHYSTQWSGSSGYQLTNPSGVAVDGSNDIYVADWGNNRIQVFTSSGTTLAIWGGPTSGTGPGQFYQPYGVAVDSGGDIYVADTTNNRVQKLPTGLAGTVGSNWIVYGGTVTGTSPGQFNNPTGVAVDGSQNLYVTDDYNNRVQKLPAGLDGTVSGNWVVYGGTGSGTNPGQFDDPLSSTCDASGDLYVADSANARIQKLPAGMDGTVGSNWVTFGTYGTGLGQFEAPAGPAFDFHGNFYVADVFDNRVDILPSGLDPTQGSNWTTIGGTAPGSGNGQFDGLHGVALDSLGNLYVADGLNNRIQKFTP